MEYTMYKLNIQGIVYLIDPATSKAYTYDLSNPIEIGKVIWTDLKEEPRMDLLPSWKTILEHKLEAPALGEPPIGTNATPD